MRKTQSVQSISVPWCAQCHARHMNATAKRKYGFVKSEFFFWLEEHWVGSSSTQAFRSIAQIDGRWRNHGVHEHLARNRSFRTRTNLQKLTSCSKLLLANQFLIREGRKKNEIKEETKFARVSGFTCFDNCLQSLCSTSQPRNNLKILVSVSHSLCRCVAFLSICHKNSRISTSKNGFLLSRQSCFFLLRSSFVFFSVFFWGVVPSHLILAKDCKICVYGILTWALWVPCSSGCTWSTSCNCHFVRRFHCVVRDMQSSIRFYKQRGLRQRHTITIIVVVIIQNPRMACDFSLSISSFDIDLFSSVNSLASKNR